MTLLGGGGSFYFEREENKKCVYERQRINEQEALAEALCVSHFA